MAMQLLGKDLAHFLKRFRKLSLKTICNLAEQLLTIIEEVHKRFIFLYIKEVLFIEILNQKTF